VAYVVQAIRPNPKERVLEVGTGSGYQTAVLASLSGVVYSVEKEGTLAEDASKTLETLGIENAHVKEGDPLKGWPENAPYDVIIVNNAVSDIPYHLSAQLAEDGRMILPLRESDAYQRLTIVSRVSGKVETQPLIIVRFDQI
jgi:protein-L-isoaspartate(D-aspartate) O-methyltransferase